MLSSTSLCLLLCLGARADAPKKATQSPAQRLAIAENAVARGEYDKAQKTLEPLLQSKLPRALALDGQMLALRGEREQAAARFHRIIDLYNAGNIQDDDAEGMWAVAEAAHGLGSYRDANQAFASAVHAAPQNVGIELAWVELFLEKNDFANAQTGVAKVLALDPKQPRALERMARLRIEQNAPVPEVEALLDQAQASDPNLSAVHVTRAAIALRDEDLPLADSELDAALKINPRDLEALSVRAAVRFLAEDGPGFERAVKQVLSEHPRFSRMYSIIATYAEWEHRYEDLVRLSDEALKLDPEDAYAHATRGMNLLRVGRETEGLDALHRAWARDHYNVLVYNTLNLYDDIINKQYVNFEAAPFQLRMHKDERGLLSRYAVPLLKKAYADMQARYGFSPLAPTFIELYASPEHFSVRTSGLPRLGLQGVCFGRVLTALSPAGGEFNWGQILWHELSHVFHVQLSKSRVPRWFTEGLAEYETKRARPEWKREDDRPLYDALIANRLPSLVQMNHAFTHARNPQDLMVAYYASSVAMEYIVTRFGFEKIPQLLRMFGQGKSLEQACPEALGISLTDLDRDFSAALRAQLGKRYASDLRVDALQYRDLSAISKAAEGPEASPEQRAAHAMALALANQDAQAQALATAVLASDPKQPLALFTRAHLALKHGDLQTSKRALDAMLAEGLDGYQIRMLLARTEHKLNDDVRALVHLSRAEALDPDRTEAYELDAELSTKLNDRARLQAALLKVSFLDQHARAPLLKLLTLLAENREYALLLERSEAGLYLDPANPDLHRLRAEALSALNSPKAAIEEAELALELARSPEDQKRARTTLAQVKNRAQSQAAEAPPLKSQAKSPVSR
ncbi:MAG: hypothetical protein QM778_35385 [Myxococcales bacterium]